MVQHIGETVELISGKPKHPLIQQRLLCFPHGYFQNEVCPSPTQKLRSPVDGIALIG